MKTEPSRRWPFFLLGIYLAETILLGIEPVSREVWLAENLCVWLPVGLLCIFYLRGIRFSNTAYTLMALFFMLHTIGGHYTFEKVPVQDLMNALGFSRNHFDRICHFLVGVFAYPLLEWTNGRGLVKSGRLAGFFAVMSIFGFAAVFEIFEMLYAVASSPEAGNAFLGSQGDIWDAQKDMLADGLGAVAATMLYFTRKKLPSSCIFEKKANVPAAH